MLGTLLRRSTTADHKKDTSASESIISSSTSIGLRSLNHGTNTTIGISTAMDPGIGIGSICDTDQCDEVFPTVTSPLLDHISDDLKFKLFAAKTIPYKSNILPLMKVDHDYNNIPEASSKSLLSTDNTRKTVSNSSAIINQNSYAFRFLLTEETNEMACVNNYRILLDHNFTKGEGSKIEQIRHSELKEYIFGSPVRSSDYIQSDKFRSVPNSDFTLITRIFYLNSISNRFAISLCISKFLFPVISESWTYISHWLTDIQDIIASIVAENAGTCKGTTNSNNMEQFTYQNRSISDGVLPVNLEIAFPDEIGKIIQVLAKKLMPCLRSMTEIPRIFLYPPDFVEFVETWFKDVFNWIEIKDGPRLRFLPMLLSKIVCEFKDSMVESDITRIIILSGNMVVANKLIFIVAGLLEPKYRNKLVSQLPPSSSSTNEENSSGTSIAQTHSSHSSSSTSTSNSVQMSVSKNRERHKQRLVNLVEATDATSTQSVDKMTSLSEHTTPISVARTSAGTATRSGWVIPKGRKNRSSVSISSNESSYGEVIQPSSSFKSVESSLQNLSSSFSSQPNSYGSWFSKRPSLSSFIPQSPSNKFSIPLPANSNSTATVSALSENKIDRVISNSSSSGGTHNHQVAAPRFPPNTFHTPQQSPSISEYEEYPWFETPESLSRMDLESSHSLPNHLNTITMTPHGNTNSVNGKNTKKLNSYCGNSTKNHDFPLKNVKINRDCQRLNQLDLLDEAFDDICNDLPMDTEYEITAGTSLHAPVLEIDMNYDNGQNKKKPLELLSRYTTYLPHYNRWFQLQGIPITNNSESMVTNSMKKDLQMGDEFSKSLIVSLRTREIKEVLMKKKMEKKPSPSSNEASSNRSSREPLKQKVKKVFFNGKVADHTPVQVDESMNFIEACIKKAMIHYEDKELDPLERDRKVINLFGSILTNSNTYDKTLTH
ncbi:Lst4p NDAI_0A00870 [Naumovozyma dairenensis CBS 421]|uniref:Protein LST4 n=1 Tax=Naumovozyma dairenensis (strain ATCC 10597 / BCRC 20456 / CBS 421 / NBRC 0211 / NRRL Y-12639) TaxID=1071378 RepID=G0W357_NAUDC|nr:hypothetical protein NDAI_0A00870 [Naumovozyma dairenensis CBS 421]CCD22245.1 hypothetical protein NDAI_0A00870 [Naumovozyma dairenensis CBS 421]